MCRGWPGGFCVDWKMERFAMNSKTTMLAAATAALLTAATVTAASAQERHSTKMNAGQSFNAGGQMNAQGPGSGQQFQNGNLSRNEGANFKNESGTSPNKYGMTSKRYSSKYS